MLKAGGAILSRCVRRCQHPSGNEMRPMKKLIRRIDNAISSRLLNLEDAMIDRRICGQSLVPYVPSIYRDDKNGIGGTGTQSTHYAFLKRIFSDVRLTEADAFMDVGCGKGRVLAFLLKEKRPCRLYGIEHNEEVAKIALDWSERYEQIQLVIGDALTHDYNPYTVLSSARSFLKQTFCDFVEHLERTMTHPVRLVFWYGQEYYCDLDNRPGWEMLKRETVGRVLGVRVGHGYSIWSFDPGKRHENNAHG